MTGYTAVNLKSGLAEFIKECTIMFAGFPCVDMSLHNMNRADFAGAVDDPLGTGGKSGTVLSDIVKFIKIHKPPIVILENVLLLDAQLPGSH
jgi:site-specific DNA-cytosine methylase